MRPRTDTQADRHTHRHTHTHRRAWPQYISRRVRLTRNVTRINGRWRTRATRAAWQPTWHCIVASEIVIHRRLRYCSRRTMDEDDDEHAANNQCDKLATERSWQRFTSKLQSRQFAATALATYHSCIWRLRWGWSRLSFTEIFGIRELKSLQGYHVALFAWS